MSRVHRNESGQVTAYVVALSLTLFGLMAFAIDIGFHFHARRVMQNAADPSALAGAAYLQGCSLAGTGEDPLVIAENFAEYNRSGKAYTAADLDPEIQIRSFPPDAEVPFQSVYTKVERRQNFIFGRFLGLTSSIVPAEAEAVCGPIQEGSVCPMWIEGDATQQPAYDESGNLTGAYGLTIGRVYGMKINSGAEHYGAIDPPTGAGIDQWRSFLAGGCSDVSQGELDVCEGCSVTSQPGNFGNPVHQALEGGGPVSYGLYEFELDASSLFPQGHLSCDLALTVDPADSTIVTAVRNYDSSGFPTGLPLNEQQTVAAINAKTDPALMATGAPPCGAIESDGTLVPQLLFEAVQGRFMDIVLTNGDCAGNCSLPVLGILRMYIVCWTNQEAPSGNIPAAKRCVPNGTPADTTIYGVFADYTAPSVLGGGGLGTNPLAPKHVVLVR